MIDAILKFADAATAKAALIEHAPLDDVGVRKWAMDHCLPITVWRNSQDVGGSHTPLSGFYVLISLPNVVPALFNHAAVQFVVDSDMAKARQAGAILRVTVTNAIMQDIRFAPIFAGRDYPFGAWI